MQTSERLLLGYLGAGDIYRIIVREIVLIHPLEPLLEVTVAPEIDIAVRGMIMRAVKIKILLVCQRRNALRIAAGAAAVGRIGIEDLAQLVKDLRIRRGRARPSSRYRQCRLPSARPRDVQARSASPPA